MAGSVTPELYEAARPDPIAPFAAPVMKHMNDGKHHTTLHLTHPCSILHIFSIVSNALYNSPIVSYPL